MPVNKHQARARDFFAFLLAAGRGSRLRPHTDTRPKPLVEVGGRPLLAYTFDKLRAVQVPHVTVNAHYKAEQIETFVAEIDIPHVTVSREDGILDTGLGVKTALATMNGEAFFVINGDALWEDSGTAPALERLAAAWDPDLMDILLLLQPLGAMPEGTGRGDYDLLPDGRARRRPEKDGAHMFAGIRICRPEVFEHTPDEPFGFLDLMDAAEKKDRLYALPHTGTWHHISTPADLEAVDALYRNREHA